MYKDKMKVNTRWLEETTRVHIAESPRGLTHEASDADTTNMLRSAKSLWPPIRPQHRHFVSTVLLSRTYEDESVAGLKKLLKDRGLSQYVVLLSCPLAPTHLAYRTGNKSTLITRIQQYDQLKTLEAVHHPTVPAGAHARNASSTASGVEVSGPVPGIPPAAQPEASLSKSAFTNINLPDLSQPVSEAPTPIVRVTAS